MDAANDSRRRQWRSSSSSANRQASSTRAVAESTAPPRQAAPAGSQHAQLVAALRARMTSYEDFAQPVGRGAGGPGPGTPELRFCSELERRTGDAQQCVTTGAHSAGRSLVWRGEGPSVEECGGEATETHCLYPSPDRQRSGAPRGGVSAAALRAVRRQLVLASPQSVHTASAPLSHVNDAAEECGSDEEEEEEESDAHLAVFDVNFASAGAHHHGRVAAAATTAKATLRGGCSPKATKSQTAVVEKQRGRDGPAPLRTPVSVLSAAQRSSLWTGTTHASDGPIATMRSSRSSGSHHHDVDSTPWMKADMQKPRRLRSGDVKPTSKQQQQQHRSCGVSLSVCGAAREGSIGGASPTTLWQWMWQGWQQSSPPAASHKGRGSRVCAILG